MLCATWWIATTSAPTRMADPVLIAADSLSHPVDIPSLFGPYRGPSQYRCAIEGTRPGWDRRSPQLQRRQGPRIPMSADLVDGFNRKPSYLPWKAGPLGPGDHGSLIGYPRPVDLSASGRAEAKPSSRIGRTLRLSNPPVNDSSKASVMTASISSRARARSLTSSTTPNTAQTLDNSARRPIEDITLPLIPHDACHMRQSGHVVKTLDPAQPRR